MTLKLMRIPTVSERYFSLDSRLLSKATFSEEMEGYLFGSIHPALDRLLILDSGSRLKWIIL